MEARALRTTLAGIPFNSCLEIGCGTGKNTQWLVEKVEQLTAVDLSEEMLARAKAKIASDRVEFIQADVTTDWAFSNRLYDLVTFSLVLEHVENLDYIFRQASLSLNPGGHIYIGELHPFKQYTGTKARFDTEIGQQVLECFTHHVSDFVQAAKKHGLALVDVGEYFDDNDKSASPRILVVLLKKI